jgi:hypothetical protein
MIAMSFSSMEPQAASFTQNMTARWHARGLRQEVDGRGFTLVLSLISSRGRRTNADPPSCQVASM